MLCGMFGINKDVLLMWDMVIKDTLSRWSLVTETEVSWSWTSSVLSFLQPACEEEADAVQRRHWEWLGEPLGSDLRKLKNKKRKRENHFSVFIYFELVSEWVVWSKQWVSSNVTYHEKSLIFLVIIYCLWRICFKVWAYCVNMKAAVTLSCHSKLAMTLHFIIS